MKISLIIYAEKTNDTINKRRKPIVLQAKSLSYMQKIIQYQ